MPLHVVPQYRREEPPRGRAVRAAWNDMGRRSAWRFWPVQSCASPGRVSSESGFTLIEVLVALTILSISLGVLLEVFTQGLDRARESRDEASARVLAQSLITQAKIEPSPAVGGSGGKTNNFLWHLSIQPWGSKDDRAAWHENVAQIRATVSWRGSGGQRSITLSTLRVLPGASGSSESSDD